VKEVDKKKSKWRWPYRLVLLNEISLGEVFSIRFTPLNFLIFITGITVFMSTLLTSVIAFTPLRELIPGYGTEEERLQIRRLSQKTDSLEKIIYLNDSILSVMKNVITGNVYALKTEKPAEFGQKKFDEKENEFKFAADFDKELENLKKKGMTPPTKPAITLTRYLFPSLDNDIKAYVDSLQRLCLESKKEVHVISPIDGKIIPAIGKENIIIIFGKGNEQVIIEGLHLISTDKEMQVSKGEYLGSSLGKVYIRIYDNGRRINPDEIF
jgi:hypothetical protein